MPEPAGERHALTRRTLIAAAGATAAIGLAAGPARAGASADPFTLGIASGDPAPDGFVLWTRLATEPLADDGLGGMPARAVDVQWEVAEDERFARVVRRGSEQAAPELGHSVHVELAGLRPGREYFYRFRCGNHLSRTGRTRTAPAAGTLTSPLTMCLASCAAWEHGFYTAYRRIAEDDPDLVLHLGDYQYEFGHLGYPVLPGIARRVEGGETFTLADYRRRHAQTKTDPDLQLAHSVAPWLVVWDDHEVDNNWADEHHEFWGDTEEFLERRRAAFQAYYENMPLRRSSVPQGIDMQLYRRVRWGALANLHMLDTRQYRSDQACGGLLGPCGQESDPSRTLTGDEQESWLLEGFRESRARWDLIGQQVMMGRHDKLAGPLKVTDMDTWDGYTASRDRITRGWVEAGVRNPVVLTGDIHEHYANDLKLDYDDPDAPVVGAELVTTSVTSNGDSAGEDFGGDPENPHIRFHDTMRGYVRTRVTSTELKADFRVLPYVSRPYAPAETKASFVVSDRVPGLQEASTFAR
ncbi:alkaline phosphatase D [Saccharopolyspora erythraea NRRL 2338]|uniref:Phosphodiesterase/alkaline phosphatase D n=2 Tax=Saccharopolyspora erythraea TaxID=1836 RepID=A4FPA7_SACEN|nr:alkaline phosphatase D family protein [Saccharopolyspora erythraea]EQD86684.1 alkaline phosphatase [Saccharopolyspora erythraea D]PFG99523.1 alkaline phosphatase D [Saccharopolyspora erythraea NRRL 2338]QRK89427.1 alkaline phosphatase D family protein [Saccharopolyspora erythraea]CAM05882.1 phosphodiesterase/alkaline phosphatase D [Saccharopolyspora erythraea NRRL 2338]